MTSRDFCYWLQGYFELTGGHCVPGEKLAYGLTHEQVAAIERHLALVFKHEIDPSMGGVDTQKELSAIHDLNTLIRC